MNKILCFIGIISFLQISCKKMPASSQALIDEDTTSIHYQPNKVPFEYFSTKTKVDILDANQSDQFALTLRVKKDSVVWASFGKAGIEGARALIRPDSVFILDKMKNESYSFDLTYLQEIIQSKVSYENIQNLLVGDLLVDYDAKKDAIRKVDSHFIINQQKDQLSIESYIRLDNYKVEKVILVDAFTTARTNILYSSFGLSDSILVPYVCGIDVEYIKDEKKQFLHVTLTHNKMEFTSKPLNFPFTIPKKYNEK